MTKGPNHKGEFGGGKSKCNSSETGECLASSGKTMWRVLWDVFISIENLQVLSGRSISQMLGDSAFF